MLLRMGINGYSAGDPTGWQIELSRGVKLQNGVTW